MTTRARVLYVTYDGLLEPLGASQVLPYVEGLTGNGFGLEILSFEKPGDLKRVERRSLVQARLDDAGVRWTPLLYHKWPSLPATGWDVLAGRRAVRRWARTVGDGPALVHARGYLPGLMGLAARGGGVRLLFDMRGFWVDERIEGGYWSAGGLPARLGRWAERTLLRDADHLVLLTRRAASRLANLSPGHAPPAFTVVPTCVDMDRFTVPTPIAREDARRRLGLGTGPILIHTGTLTGWYEGDRTMEVGRRFVERSGGHFVVLTRDVPEAERMARAAGVAARVEAAPSHDVPLWLAAADAGLALVRCLPSKDASFPTKVGEYLAAGLAVLTTPVGDLEDFQDPGALRLLRPGEDVAASVTWLLEAVGSPIRQSSARKIAEERLGLAAGVSALARVYEALGTRRTA
jgi:glycosyltransferase involved in cell wall biosynthesis